MIEFLLMSCLVTGTMSIWFIPGQNCGITKEIRSLKHLPEDFDGDLSGLECTILKASIPGTYKSSASTCIGFGHERVISKSGSFLLGLNAPPLVEVAPSRERPSVAIPLAKCMTLQLAVRDMRFRTPLVMKISVKVRGRNSLRGAFHSHKSNLYSYVLSLSFSSRIHQIGCDKGVSPGSRIPSG